MTIKEVFMHRLGMEVEENYAGLDQFTPCGQTCQTTIEAAFLFIRSLRSEVSEGDLDAIKHATKHACDTFWYG